MKAQASVKFETSLGSKLWVGATAVLLSGWSVLHMGGNLLVFGGPELMNRYGSVLQSSPLLWPMRAGVLALLLIHAGRAMTLWRKNRRAAGSGYQGPRSFARASFASRSMALSGPLIGALLAYHVLHIYGVGHGSYRPGDVHHNLVAGLSHPGVALAYGLLALVFGVHLQHGLASACRTLGWERGARARAPRLVALALTVGFMAPAVAVQAGLV